VAANHLILVCGDQDLKVGVEAAQYKRPGLTVWVMGFRDHISHIWRNYGSIFYLETLDVWDKQEGAEHTPRAGHSPIHSFGVIFHSLR
jgi:hypothetical protein